jgi:glutamate racemase
MHLAILDWGIGGLPTLAALQDARPDWSTTYISDAGFTPYGKVPADGLAARLGTLAKHAADAGADALIVACNAMSTVLDDSTPSRTAGDVALALPVFGIIGPGGSLALAADARVIGVIGGLRTIEAGHHAAALRAAGRHVVAAPAQPLSAHVEAGRLSGPTVEADIDAVLAELSRRGPPVDALLLACTHYPALTPHFATRLPGVAMLDPAEALVHTVLSRIDEGADTTGPARHEVWTSGDPEALRTGARLAFGIDVGPVVRRIAVAG